MKFVKRIYHDEDLGRAYSLLFYTRKYIFSDWTLSSLDMPLDKSASLVRDVSTVVDKLFQKICKNRSGRLFLGLLSVPVRFHVGEIVEDRIFFYPPYHSGEDQSPVKQKMSFRCPLLQYTIEFLFLQAARTDNLKLQAEKFQHLPGALQYCRLVLQTC